MSLKVSENYIENLLGELLVCHNRERNSVYLNHRKFSYVIGSIEKKEVSKNGIESLEEFEALQEMSILSFTPNKTTNKIVVLQRPFMFMLNSIITS